VLVDFGPWPIHPFGYADAGRTSSWASALSACRFEAWPSRAEALPQTPTTMTKQAAVAMATLVNRGAHRLARIPDPFGLLVTCGRNTRVDRSRRDSGSWWNRSSPHIHSGRSARRVRVQGEGRNSVSSALLVMDVQNGIVDRVGEHSASLLTTLARTVGAARTGGVPVIYVRVAFRQGAPEISARNKSFATARSSALNELDPATSVHPAVDPQPGDIVVTKRRVSAFAGSDLDVVLRSLEADSLVLTGFATSGVVLSTVRQAADLDFRLTVLSDGCADGDPEVHRVLMEKVFPKQASVMTAAEWIEGIARGEPEPG
jgi:nicotinamidase-related amidase